MAELKDITKNIKDLLLEAAKTKDWDRYNQIYKQYIELLDKNNR